MNKKTPISMTIFAKFELQFCVIVYPTLVNLTIFLVYFRFYGSWPNPDKKYYDTRFFLDKIPPFLKTVFS